MMTLPRLAMAFAALATASIADLAAAQEPERVTFPSADKNAPPITGYLYKAPRSGGRVPGVIGLHGCGGLFDGKGRISSRHSDWAQRWQAAGYTVLLADSFSARGLTSICQIKDRTITPRQRGYDAIGAARYLAADPNVDPARLALVGWSHGGSTTLWTIGDKNRAEAPPFRVAIAFYPGCRVPSESHFFEPRLKPHVLIGSADDWTPVEPCRVLRDRGAITLVEYEGAYHGFDAPNQPIRQRKGVAFSKNGDGIVHSGTDPKARAAAIVEVTRLLSTAFGR